MASDDSNAEPDGLPCTRISCAENIASLEHQVGKTAVKVSRLERHIRQQEQETERQRQRNNALSSTNEKLTLEMGELQEKLKAPEATSNQHIQTKDLHDKLEEPASVLQQQLHEERDKASKLQSQVKNLRASAMVLKEAVSESEARQAELAGNLKSMEAFINDYCRVTEKTFRLSLETTLAENGDNIRCIGDILRRIEDRENRVPDRLRSRVDKNLQFRDIRARQHGLTFTNGNITRLQANVDSNDAGNRGLETRELSTIQRESPGSAGRHSTCAEGTGGKSNKDGLEHRQATGGKRSRDSGAPGDGQSEKRDEGEAKKMKIEGAIGREHTTPSIAVPNVPGDPRPLAAAGALLAPRNPRWPGPGRGGKCPLTPEGQDCSRRDRASR